MRRLLPVAVLLLLAGPSLAGDDAPVWKTPSGWFDMAHCVFCRHLIADPGLLPHTTWENFAVSDGMVNLTAVAPEYAASMATCSAAMQDVAAQLQSGRLDPRQAPMCGHCQAYGSLLMAGVKMETVKGKAVEVTLVRSADPAVVARIHEMVRRDNEEMAILMAATAASGDPR